MSVATTKPTKAIYGKLIALDRQLKSQGIESLHDRVTALIGACIAEGVDTGGLIISVLEKLGFNPQHVGMLLTDEAKKNLGSPLWRRDIDGHYRLN